MSSISGQPAMPIETWGTFARWVAASLAELDLADVFEIGPTSAEIEVDEHVPNIVVQKLDDEHVWVQLSTTVVAPRTLSTYAVSGVLLDSWIHDDSVCDATHGFLVSRDLDLVADAVVTWFRDRQGVHFTELGCELTPATRLSTHR